MKPDTPPSEKPELLAPAGNLETALSAFEAGADAVYAGLGKFNARERADNFTWEDLSRLAAYAKQRDKKYYLTFNTLVKESELTEAARLLASAVPLEPDAVIVQDLGILRMIRHEFPELSLHASTQMGIHNSAGLKLAAQLGLERVILERQIDLEEMEILAAKSPVELEVFIHGALCCSLSGRCLFSSWIGGWSGNRGRCKQPCRRRYHTRPGSQEKTPEEKQNGFFFSPQDLYSLDLLPRLMELGISSLKIEGRLKKPDSISRTVEAYRLVLDAPDPASREVQKEARGILSGAYGRRWSSGFTTGESRKTLIQPQSLGVSGQLIGEVVSLQRGQALLELSRPLRRGDRLRFQPRSGEEGPAVTVLKYTSLSSSSPRRIRLPLPREKEIAPRALVYRIGESRREKKLNREKLPPYSPAHRAGLSIHLSSGALTVKILSWDGGQEPEGLPFHWEKPVQAEPARKKALSAQDLKDLFHATRDKRILPRFLSVQVEEGLFLPPSRLKQLRREFWESGRSLLNRWADEPVHPAPSPGISEGGSKTPAENRTPGKTAGPPLVSCRTADPSQLPPDTIAVLPLHQIIPVLNQHPSLEAGRLEAELPFFCIETDLPRLEKLLREVLSRGIRRYRLTAPYQLALLPALSPSPKGAYITLTAGYPFPAANHLTAETLQEWGIDRFQGWLEMEKKALIALQEAAPLPMEVYRRGKPLLLATRAELPASGRITDSRGKAFYVTSPPAGCPWNHQLTCLYPAAPFLNEGLPGSDAYEDHLRLFEDDGPPEDFNWNTEWM